MPRSWEKIELGEFQDQKDDWIISSWEQGARGRERWARTGEARKDQTTGAPGATARVSWFIPWEGKSTKWFGSVQSLSRVRLFATLWTAAHQASLSITNSQSSPKLMSTESVMPSSHLILCCPLLLLPSDFPSIRVFSNESALCMRWPKCWSFSFNISPSNEHPGLISFRIDWLDLLAVQGTHKSLLQYHSAKWSKIYKREGGGWEGQGGCNWVYMWGSPGCSRKDWKQVVGRLGQRPLRCWCQSLGPNWGEWREGEMDQSRDQEGELERTQPWVVDAECQRGNRNGLVCSKLCLHLQRG